MKGRIAIRTVVLLAIAVIVIAVALYFLVFVVNFDSLFLSNDQRILKQYATCALAYCANGNKSDQVNAVGCLKSEGGKCVLSCVQVDEEIYQKNNVLPLPEYFGRTHYCGKEAALEFEFSGISLGNTVPLASGQIDKIATRPQWLCKPVKFPLTNIYVDQISLILGGFDTAEIQYTGSALAGTIRFSKDCIMFAPYASIVPASNPFDSEIISGGGCFTGIYYKVNVGHQYLYTPLIEYESDEQKNHPSAIYLNENDGFTTPLLDHQKPECMLEGDSNEKVEKIYPTIDNVLIPESLLNSLTLDQKSKTVLKSYDELTEEDKEKVKLIEEQRKKVPSRISKCNLKTTYQGKKIKYRVWADPSVPPYPLYQLGEATAGKFGESQEIGSCTSVTLSRNLKGTPITTEDIAKEAEKLQFSEPTVVSGITTANSENSPFALIDGQKTYLFFERTTGDAFKPSDVSKEIWYTVSEDGGSTWQEAKRITDYSAGIAGSEPSAVVFNGKIHIAYKEKSFGQGVKIETKNFIVVKELGGTYEKRFADVETNERGGPAMAVFDGRLFLFYHQRAGQLIGGDFFKILYTTWDGNPDHDWQSLTLVPTPKKDGVPNFLNSPNAWSMYPNALATSNGIMLSYSYSAQTGQIGPFHEAFDVRAVRFDGKGTSEDLGEISADESGTDIPNRRQGFSHLVEKNGEIFVFYDEDDIARGGKTVDPTEAEFKSHINYKKYNPDSGWDVFPTSLFETKSKALQPTPVAVGDKILLFLSSNEGSNRWDILSSVGEKKIVLTEVPKGPDAVQGISGKTEKDSYKKGETIKFVGSLTMASGKPEGKEVRILLKFGPAELLNQDASVAADGSFVWEYALPAGVAIGTYEIAASSGGKEVSYKFAVTG